MGGKNDGKRNLYEVSILERGIGHRGVGREKGNKEHIEGNREKKCPGETRRSFSGVSGKDRGLDFAFLVSTIKNLDLSSNRQQTFRETSFNLANR